MPNKFIEQAKSQMGAVEEMLKGLPGIEGYVEKELRRDADYQLRQTIAAQLEKQKQRLLRLMRPPQKLWPMRKNKKILPLQKKNDQTYLVWKPKRPKIRPKRHSPASGKQRLRLLTICWRRPMKIFST